MAFNLSPETAKAVLPVVIAKPNAIKVTTGQKNLIMPVFYVTQLLGLAMGMKFNELGLNLNLSPVDEALKKLVNFQHESC